jgi:type I polyketide synthase PikAII
MTAKLTPADLARIQRQGILPLTTAQGLQLLDEAIERREPLLVPARLERSATATEARLSIPRRLVDAGPPEAASTARPQAEDAPPASAVRNRLAGLAPAERRSALLDVVRREVGTVFRLPIQAVPEDQPLRSLGLDSLMAVELRDRLGTALSATLPATLVFDHPTPADIARFVATAITDDGGAPNAVPDEEGAVRRALLSLPLDVLRRNGLLNRLLELAGGATAAAAPPSAIDELSNEELVTLVRSL